MRNSTIKAFATGMAVCAAVVAGVAFAARASAVPVDDVDMSQQAINYVHEYKQYICGAIMGNPTPSGVVSALRLVANDGWNAYESGTIVGYAVADACPSVWPVLEEFVASTPTGAAA